MQNNQIKTILVATLLSTATWAQTPPPPAAPATTTTTTASPTSTSAAPNANAATSAAPPPATNSSTETTSSFYYYCQSSRAYYPTVSFCHEGWVAIPVGTPPAGAATTTRQPLTFTPWQEPETAETRAIIRSQPNVLSLEFMGRAMAYSVNFDKAATEKWSFGLGLSSWEESWHWSQYHSTVTVVPLYGDYYLSNKLSRGYFTGGLDFINTSHQSGNSNNFQNSGVAAVGGVGYEARDPNGFLLRLAAYLIVGRSVYFNPGVSFGYAF